MSCCSIFNKSFLSDADFTTAVIDITSLTTLLSPFDQKTSGLWKPLVINNKHSTIKYGDLLSQADSTLNAAFNPCSCSPIITNYDEIESLDSFRCSYCSSLENNESHVVSWKLKDIQGNESYKLSSNCCNGACDIRMDKDDYLPKIPTLNQKYLDQFYDFKHMKQFPAIGSGLGFEKFIKFGDGSNNPLNSFTNNSYTPQLCIDWELKPRIAEIPYDPITSQYDNIDDHNKAYKKYLQTGSTCGHFILTKLNDEGSVSYTTDILFSGLMGEDSEVDTTEYPLPESTVSSDITTLLPSIKDFSDLPYGFAKTTYNNIFVKTEKLASYWRWNYSSGIIGWYRYYDKDRKNDKRPIPGIDLYISPGDVFYAKNDGPEPISNTTPQSQDRTPVINSCPSGIKLIKDSTVIGVIPSGSSFTYISANLYPLMRDIYSRIDNADKQSAKRPNSMTTLQKFELAALLSTAPQYDAVVVDLLKTMDLDPEQLDQDQQPVKPINDYRQRDQMNKDMSTSPIDSSSHMNFVSSQEELIHTLANKYGSYLWCDTNTTSILEFTKDINAQSYIDLSFDMGIKIKDTRRLLGGCSSEIDCADHTTSQFKAFSYDQSIELGNLKIESKTNTRKRYASACNSIDGNLTIIKSASMAGIFLNDHLLKELVYFTGCSTFENTYPRPFIKDSTRSCSSCEDGSSYKLAVKLNPTICSGSEGDDSFCDEPSARFNNNSEGLIEGTRPGRTILDGSLYDQRKYHAAIMNPRIDKAAFHHQGGVYYDSKVFGANNSTIFNKETPSLTTGKCRITFTTKDVGIKIYGLNIEKLRGSDPNTYECLGFPNKNECQCFSINTITEYPHICGQNGEVTYSNEPLLFTPNLSTTNGPIFKAYGGYSEDYITQLLDSSRIPNHPDIGSSLTSLAQKIDPEQPYGCSQSVTVSFPNYVKTEWNFSLPSYSTIHADVWAEVIENVDLFRTTSYSQTFDEDGNLEWTPSPNIGYQRFATRVSLNDIMIYDKQKKPFILKGGSSASSVKAILVNPYLEALGGNDNLILYPPVGNFCSTNTVFGSLGNQSIDLMIKFERIPRKQMLNFAVPAPVQMGTLKKGFFHPNTGLIYNGDKTNKTSVVRDNNLISYIDYDKEVFREDAEFQDGKMLIGEMNDKLKETLRQIGELNSHKKIRLYLKIQNQWWEYNDPNIFGYFKDGKKYVGKPYLFEYTTKDNSTDLSGPILPVSTKEHLDFNFFYNFTYDLFNTKNTYYPIVNTRFLRGRDETKIVIEGSRPYFLVAEHTENNTSRLNTKFTELQIDYNRKNKVGYVHNTKKNCDQKVLISSSENPKLSYIGKIIGKSIYAIYVDKDGNKLNYNDNIHDKYLKIYTEFVLDAKVKYSIGNLDFTFLGKIPQITIDNAADLTEIFDKSQDIKMGIDSLIIYQDISEALKSEYDPLLRNPIYSTKWGDLIDFDGKLTNELGQYIYNTGYLHDFYPDSLYKNLFFKTIINNANNNLYNYNFKIKDQKNKDKNILITYNGQTSYVIHQKYNIGDGNNSIVRKTFRDYNNYLPFMDINFIPDYGVYENSVRENLKPVLKDLLIKDTSVLKDLLQNQSFIYSGIVQISGIYKNLSADHKWEEGYLNPNDKSLFFLDLQKKEDQLKSALTIKQDQIFYTNTLRVDDVPFQLYSVESNSIINDQGIRAGGTFKPVVPTNTTTFQSVTFDFDHFTNTEYKSVPFIKMPVYGDTDKVQGCGSVGCGINTVGSVAFSGIYHIQMPKTISLPENLNDIPYIISYDAGIYNPIGNHQLYYIERLELDPTNTNNTLFTTNNCNANISPRPTINRISVLNEEYQAIMRDSIVEDHTDIVKNTDIFANEMLFRMMYGEKQKINLKTIDDHTSQPIKFNDLIKYTDPKTEAKDIYKNIPYNLDTEASSSNRKISGSLSIQGKLIVGKTVSVTIGNKNMTISVVNSNGKIKIIVNVDGQTIERVIHTEYVENHNLAVSDQELSNTSTTRYDFLTTCQEIASPSISFVSQHPKGVMYGAFECDGITRFDLKLPYWPKGSKCPVTTWKVDTPYPMCNPDYGSPPGYVVQYIPAVGCVGTLVYSPPEFTCTNLGIGYSVKDVIDPDNCKILTSTSNTLKLGGYARGVWNVYNSECYLEGSISNSTKTNSLELGIGGRIIGHPLGVPTLRSVSEPSCGTCFTDSYKDPLTKNLYYDPITGRSFPPAAGDAENHCDCADWEYGYCRNSADGNCACRATDGSSLQYDYQEFDYNFEYCRYQIQLKGHKRTIKYGSADARKVTPLDSCAGYTGTGASYSRLGKIGGEITEECAWVECDYGSASTWYIYDAVTRSSSTLYNPVCPTTLCSIDYDNNSLTINFPSGPSHCISHSIRNDCPVIKVTVPDDTFTVSDSISSNCDNCEVEPNKITMPPQSQSWDIITETRTCILGYFLSSPDTNIDGPIALNSQSIGCGLCNGCCSNCCGDGGEYTSAGYGLCGKEAPDSFPWTTCISFSLDAPRICVGGNTRSRAIISGCDIPVFFPASNSVALSRKMDIWQNQMEQILRNISPCYNNTSLNENDIVQGVVPGFCSPVLYTNITYPAIKYRATLTEPVLNTTSVTYKVAYYTYEYRRPRTIQDTFKTDAIREKCDRIKGSCPTGSINTTEIYKTADCESTLQCYNTDIPVCDNTDYCCRAGKKTNTRSQH